MTLTAQDYRDRHNEGPEDFAPEPDARDVARDRIYRALLVLFHGTQPPSAAAIARAAGVMVDVIDEAVSS